MKGHHMMSQFIPQTTSRWLVMGAISLSLVFAGCSQDSGSSQFNFLETDKNSGKNTPCGISTSLPESNEVRAPGAASATTEFVASPNNPECQVEYYLNGTLLIDFTGANILLPSSRLNPGLNTLIARVSGAKLSTNLPTSRTWSIRKNSIPTCTSPIPAITGNTTGVGGRFDMSITVDDADNDTLQASWTINGNPAPDGFITSSITGATLTGFLVAQEENRGSMAIRARVSDGTDTIECPWNLSVNDSCAFSAYSPSNSTVRVANAGTTSTQFVGVPNNGGCQVNWLLNGSPLVTNTSVVNLLSSNLNAGSNILRAVVSDGITNTVREWTVQKNAPPTCLSQNPAASGSAVTLGSSQLMTAMATDPENDTLAWTWTLNGTPPSPGIFSTVSGGTSSLTTFIPTTPGVSAGAQSIVATFNDGYDNGTCSWSVNVNNACTINASSPSGTSVRVPASNTASSTFSVTPSDSGCPISWTLNGLPLVGTAATRIIQSSSLASGQNLLVATATNGSFTWYVSKNAAPTCGSQSPTPAGSSIGVGVARVFAISPADAEGDTFSFTWKMNGLTLPPQFSVNNQPTNSQATFTPAGSQTGNQTLTTDVYDGYDTTVCSWQTTVVPQCSVTTASPIGAAVKVSAIGSTSNQFTVLPNDGSCSIEWKINGGPTISTSSVVNILSSQLITGANTITARLHNVVGSTTQSWSVTRNVAPACSSQSPSSTGSSVGVGQQINYIATAANTDSDPLTFNWTLNGTTVPGIVLSVTNNGNVSEGLFSPTISHVGAATVSAAISDGTDSATCTWSTTVSPNCAITSSTPAGATWKVSAQPAASASFGVVPNDASCAVNWTLNGSPYGSASVFQNVPSSLLNSGANTVVATITNGTSTATRTWTLNKNQIPSCISQNPAASGTQIDLGNFRDFSGVANDADGDTFTYGWRWNGADIPALFTNVTAGATTFGARFTPGVGHVGSGQSLTTQISDGYDSASCNWDVSVLDPNTVTVQACLPSGNPVVITSAGTNASRDFAVSATGTGLTYTWTLNGNVQSGQTAPNFNLTAGTLGVGMHTLIATVTDLYNNQASCTYNVKRNAPPVLASPNPANTSQFRLNYAGTQAMGISATDANGDSLSYTWKIDGNVQPTYLASGATTSLFNPQSAAALLGARAISVEVSDSHEVSTQSWAFQVNSFSPQCNLVMNGTVSGVGSTGGAICTLIGYPGVGHQMNPITEDQSKVRIRPVKVIEDDLGNIIFTDHISHAIFYYNRSVSSVNRFGQVIAAGNLAAILGAGAAGENSQTFSSGLSFKMNAPMGIAYDAEGDRLYFADYNNHRVMYITHDSNTPVRFLGTGANQNDSARNTEGAKGDTQNCVHPAEVLIRGSGANRRLYVACSFNNAIKMVNADHLSAAYGNTNIIVGRMVSGATHGGYSDGSLGPSGRAEVIGPWAMAFDPNNILYFTENTAWNNFLGHNSNSFRVRALNLGSTTLNFMEGRTLSHGFRLHARDLSSGGAWSRVSADITASFGGAASTIFVNGPTVIANNACQPLEIILRDGSGVATRATSNTLVSLTTGGYGSLFSDPTCTTGISDRTILNGFGNAIVYYKHNVNGVGAITATASGFIGYVHSVTVETPTTGNALVMTAAPSYYYASCSLVTIRAMNGGNIATTAVDRPINVFTNSAGQFYQDSNCSGTPVSEVTFANGSHTLNLYYARTVRLAPNQMASILGRNQTEQNYGGIQSVRGSRAGVPEYGMLLPWVPRGIEIDWSGGALRGLYISNWDQQRIEYLNNSGATMSHGGFAFEAGDQFDVVGYYGGGFVDETAGPNARINLAYHLSRNNAGTQLWLADHNNGRIRAFSLTDTHLTSSTIIGAGYLRNGFANDSAAPATETRLNAPYRLAIDNTNQELFFSDRSVCRIRKVSMLTGMVETAISRGCGDVTTNDVAEMVVARTVRDIAVTVVSGVRWLLFSDNQDAGNNAINSTSMIRAWNTSLSPATIYGKTINARSVSNVAGDFNRGTGSWDSPVGSNTDGMVAENARLFNPDGIAITPDGSMYIGLYADHCIVRMAANGTISRFLGPCDGVYRNPVDGPMFDGSMNRIATTSQVGAIVMDPVHTADGNFFFTDYVAQGTSRLRYVNFKNTDVTIGDTTVTAGSGSNPTIRTIWTIANNGSGMTGLAVFSNQICYSAGSWWGDGNWGPHNVTCKDRFSPIGVVTLRVGPPESSPTRAGGPFGLEQEGAAANAAFLNGPTDIKFDSQGNLYIVDAHNHMIRFVRRWW